MFETWAPVLLCSAIHLFASSRWQWIYYMLGSLVCFFVHTESVNFLRWLRIVKRSSSSRPLIRQRRLIVSTKVLMRALQCIVLAFRACQLYRAQRSSGICAASCRRVEIVSELFGFSPRRQEFVEYRVTACINLMYCWNSLKYSDIVTFV
jgi:hypothetical protein